MTVAKACIICGDTLSSKSNVNRHVQQKHPSRKKKTVLNNISQVQFQKHNDNVIYIHILNKKLWNLLLILLNIKNITIVHQEQ